MIKRIFLMRFLTAGLFVLAVLTSLPGFSSSEYIYRQRVNWVKIINASPKEVPLGSLRHPYTAVTAEQMEAMLLSIKIARRYLLQKDVETADVFNSWEARKFSAYLVQALAKADADHVVNFSVVHKRPLFILRNDRISIGNLWVAEDGIHFQFTKLFAKLTGDYEQATNMDKELRRAKTRRVTLEAHQGQKLSYASPTEVIMDPGYDFITQAHIELQQEQIAEEEKLKGKKGRKAKKEEEKEPAVTEATASQPAAPSKPAAGSVSSPASEGSVSDRLRELEQLKKEGLITSQEYQKLRQKILSEI